MKQLATTLLDDAAKYFKSARQNLYAGAALLYKIKESSLWEEKYNSFGEYVEQECQISASRASQLTQMWKYYVIDGGVPKNRLVGIDVDKLYLAAKLPKGTMEQRLVRAQEWNRNDLRAELHTVEGKECEHPEDKRVILCGTCGKRVA